MEWGLFFYAFISNISGPYKSDTKTPNKSPLEKGKIVASILLYTDTEVL